MPKRGENIYKRKDGRWEGRYIRGRTASGQAEYGYVYADSYKACRAKRQQCIETLPEKPAVQASAATLAQAAELFLSEKSHVLKASSWNRYSYLTQHYILPALGTAPICQLTADQISDFLRRLQRSGLSGKSARDIGVLLKSILKYTAKKLDCSCPGVNAELPVYHRKKIEVFFADEIGRLAKKVLEAPSMAGVGVLLALNAGLRLGELCALQYKDIDLCNGVIHVTKTAQRMKKGMHTHLARNEENYFLSGKSAPLEPRTLQYQYRALLKAAGIPYRNFHVLRHTYASRCVEQGVDIKSLSEMLGHADVRTTLQVYVHSSLEHKMRVVQSICFLSLAPAADFAPSTFPSHGPETALRQRVFPNLSQIV